MTPQQRYYQRNKALANARAKAWVKARPERRRAIKAKHDAKHPGRNRWYSLNARAKEFGHAPPALNRDEFCAWYQAQDLTKCQACDRVLKGKRLCVDHCHKTGRVRGILCMSCNTALGFIEGPARSRLDAYLEAAL